MKLADWIVLAGSIAALLTFWVMRTTARLQLRAYIGVDERASPSERHLVLQLDGSIKGLAIATNHGQTPAHNVHVRSLIGRSFVPLRADFDFPALEYKAAGPLFPGQTLTIQAQMTPPVGSPALTPAQWMATLRPFGAAETWYFYGFVTYQDIYGANRYTRFCFEIWWNHGPGDVPGWYSAPRFNDIDGSERGWWRRILRFLMP